jgi:hypothetical protein
MLDRRTPIAGVPPTPRSVTIAARPEPLAVVPEETALIVVDMQNAYLSKDGYLDLCGFDISGAPPVIAEVARAAAEFNVTAFFGWLTTAAALRAALMANAR